MHNEKARLQPIVREFSWTKNFATFGRCKDNLEREFYLEALNERNTRIRQLALSSAVKNKTIVEYALRTASRPIGMATYTIVPQLPENYRDELPSSEAIAEWLLL